MVEVRPDSPGTVHLVYDVQATTTHSPEVLENARKIWRENVLNVKIPHATIFSRSYNEKTPIGLLDPSHPGALAYDLFAEWLVESNNENETAENQRF